jgi:tripartite-type tricarboxylate transporter receptor subunit TctC
MRLIGRRLGFFAALAALAAALAGPRLSTGAAFPDHPITLIVPWDAGGSTDQTARVLAKAAEADLGQPVVILNKPGATTTLGMAELAAAKPDGYTLGTLSSSTYLIPLRGRSVPYDMLKSFSFVSYYGDNLIGVAVLSDAKWKTLRDLIEDGKAHPGHVKYGTAGVGTTQHLTTEAFSLASGAKFVHVPQKGSAGSMPALLGHHVDFITETSVWAPYVEAKKARLLAVTTPTRDEGYPDVPTMKELGFDSIRSIQAIVGPAGIPEPVRARLETAFRKATADPAFRETMKRLHMQVIDLPGRDVEQIVRTEITRARELLGKLEHGK